MTDAKPTVTRFEALSTNYSCTLPVRYSASPVRYSTSPVRREVVHHAEPIVERVVEYENVCTPELMAHAASVKVEAEKMRLRAREYEKLAEEHRALSAQFNDQCQTNYRARVDFEA